MRCFFAAGGGESKYQNENEVVGVRSGISRRSKALVLKLVEGDTFKQIANARELWQVCLDAATQRARWR